MMRMTPFAGLLFVSIFPAAVADDAALLEWLAGCWERRSADGVYEEQWMAPLAGEMFGVSRTVMKGKLSGFEFLRISLDTESGDVRYTAMPSGQATTVFTLVSLVAGQRLVFENPAHDFPQRIIYSINGDELLARIEGERNGKTRGVDFRMQRVRCAGQAAD